MTARAALAAEQLDRRCGFGTDGFVDHLNFLPWMNCPRLRTAIRRRRVGKFSWPATLPLSRLAPRDADSPAAKRALTISAIGWLSVMISFRLGDWLVCLLAADHWWTPMPRDVHRSAGARGVPSRVGVAARSIEVHDLGRFRRGCKGCSFSYPFPCARGIGSKDFPRKSCTPAPRSAPRMPLNPRTPRRMAGLIPWICSIRL